MVSYCALLLHVELLMVISSFGNLCADSGVMHMYKSESKDMLSRLVILAIACVHVSP